MVIVFFSFTCVLPVLSSVSSLFICPSFSLVHPEVAANVLVTHTAVSINGEGGAL